jgi:hypothetical protein
VTNRVQVLGAGDITEQQALHLAAENQLNIERSLLKEAVAMEFREREQILARAA